MFSSFFWDLLVITWFKYKLIFNVLVLIIFSRVTPTVKTAFLVFHVSFI